MTHSGTRTPRRLAPLVLVAAGLLGCGAQTPGAAAVVDAQQIPVTQLQSDTQELLDAARSSASGASDLDPATAQRGVLTQLIRGDLLERVASRNSVQVSDGEVDTLLQQVETQAGGREALDQELIQAAIPPGRLRPTVRQIALQNALVQRLAPQATSPDEALEAVRRQLVDTSRAVGVEVNPRYGTWDAEQLAISGSPSGGLATPLTPTSS